MKKLIAIMLVAIVPFITMAQKRTKKDKDYSNKYEFMIIKGLEINHAQIEDERALTDGSASDVASEEQVHNLLEGGSKLIISFDSGDNTSEDVLKLKNNAHSMRTMAVAVNMAASSGWEFINSTVVDKNIALIHYYYMRRTK